MKKKSVGMTVKAGAGRNPAAVCKEPHPQPQPRASKLEGVGGVTHTHIHCTLFLDFFLMRWMPSRTLVMS